jgi:hypothetical protein
MDCGKWLEKCGSCPLLAITRRAVFDLTFSCSGGNQIVFGFKKLLVAAPSQWNAERIKASKIGVGDVAVVHNGVDFGFFAERDGFAQKTAWRWKQKCGAGRRSRPDGRQERREVRDGNCREAERRKHPVRSGRS